MIISELTYKEYLSIMNSPMANVTEQAIPVVDIWPYVSCLVDLKLVPEIVLDNCLVEAVYRDQTESYDHILLPTGNKNVVVCLIVDIRSNDIKGYYILDLAKEYGLD